MICTPTSSAHFLVAKLDSAGLWQNAPAEAFTDAEVREVHKATRFLRRERGADSVDLADGTIRVSWLWSFQRERAHARLA